jgi:drug/metabolite transporter (DMT)-like permease
MILLTVTTLVCVTANLVIEYYKDKHYNTNSVMFVAEILKLLVSFTITQWMVPWNVPSLNFYFAINAALYCGINLLTWVILALVPPALYVMLLQHRMFWVVSLSAVFLKRRYTRRHYTACFLVLIGCVIVNYRDALYDRPSVLGVFYIMLQAFLSGLTAVWTEKMMKAARGPPAAIAHDAVRLKLYWFLVDSYQMYLFGLPMYFAVAVYGSADRAEVPPFELLRVASLFVCHGMLLGAVYVCK